MATTFVAQPLPKTPCTLQEAIARMEGFYRQSPVPDRCQRNNNPGDIEYGPFAKEHGATGRDPRFAIFPSAEVGFSCLTALMKAKYSEHTVKDMINVYAPPCENDTLDYVELVCKWTGLQPTDIVGEHI